VFKATYFNVNGTAPKEEWGMILDLNGSINKKYEMETEDDIEEEEGFKNSK